MGRNTNFKSLRTFGSTAALKSCFWAIFLLYLGKEAFIMVTMTEEKRVLNYREVEAEYDGR